MKKLINDGWEFLKLPTGSTSEQAKIHSDWTAVDLPHDWLIWQHADLYENADAWYRRKLTVDPLPESCILYFEGVYMDCDILLNDEKVGCHAYGYTSFQVDLTGKLRAGQNDLMVHIRHQSPNSRWYSGSGIFRDVYLLSLPENHLVPDSFYFVESETVSGWKLEIEAETSQKDSGLFSCEAINASGQIIARGQTNSMNGRISLSLELDDFFYPSPPKEGAARPPEWDTVVRETAGAACAFPFGRTGTRAPSRPQGPRRRGVG